MSKELRTVYIATLLILLLLLTSNPVYSASVISVDRIITPENGGLVYVIDKINVSGDRFKFGIVEEMHNRLLSLSVENGEYTFIGRKSGGVYIYEITPNSNIVIITAIYERLVTDSGGNNYDLVINAEPFIEGQEVNVNILMPVTEYVRYPAAPTGWTLTEKGLEKNNVTVAGNAPGEPVRIRFISSGIALIQIESLEINYRPSDTSLLILMKVQNVGNNKLSQLVLRMPDGIEVKEVYDNLGKIVYSWSREKRTLTINLEQSRYALQNSWKYSFSILAKCTSSGVMSFEEDKLRFLAFTPINASISSLTLSALLPIGYKADLNSNDLAEYRQDKSGAMLAVLNTQGLNVYSAKTLSLSLVKSSSMIPIAQWLAGCGLVVILVSAVLVQRIRKKVRVKIISQKNGQLISKIIVELQKIRSILLELENVLSPSEAEIKPQAVTDKLYVIRRYFDNVINMLGKIEERPEDLQMMIGEINSTAGKLNETLRVLIRNYTDFQKRELSITSYKKIYDSFRKDIREVHDKLVNLEEMFNELVKK